jgi:photosystem II stability/assembly factor-like uncharacterized protein
MTTWNQATASGIGDVAASPRDATVWVAGKDNGTIWFSKKPNRDYAGKQFTQMQASRVKRLSVWQTESPSDFPSGELWAIGEQGAAWHCRYDTGTKRFLSDWTRTPTAGMADVTVSPDGTVWFAGQDGSIFFSIDRGVTLHKTQASGMSRICAGPDGTVWAVGSNGTLWSCTLSPPAFPLNSDQWVQTPASGMGDIGVHPFFGTLWLAGKNGTIWYSTDRGRNFTRVEDASGFESVAAGTLNSGVDVWGVGVNATLWYKTPEYAAAAPTKYFHIQYDKSLGQAGVDASNGLAQVVDQIYQQQATLCGLSIIPAPVQLTVGAITGGGVSGGTASIDIHTAANADSGLASYDLSQARYVFASESAEICMRAQNGGWNPSNSKGEALSRYLGEAAYPGAGARYGYLTAKSWINQLDRGDWVTVNRGDDTTDEATGCAILFLNYMVIQRNLDIKAIVADKSPLLSEVYMHLTGERDAYGPFRDLIERHFPAKTSFQSFPPPNYPYTLQSDNPFPLPG